MQLGVLVAVVTAISINSSINNTSKNISSSNNIIKKIRIIIIIIIISPVFRCLRPWRSLVESFCRACASTWRRRTLRFRV